MSDIFISYSRADAPLVHKLHYVLVDKKYGIDSFIDIEDIAYSDDWWTQICEGIENADNFIFVISPNSLISEYCFLELEHAREYNKRIITIKLADIDIKKIAGEWFELGETWLQRGPSNWKFLNTIQWQPYVDGDGFDEFCKNLVQTIKEDPGNVRRHTYWLTRAKEWENKGRKIAFLLRDDELREADYWITFEKEKPPQPTELHKEYIQASIEQQRQSAQQLKRRNRLLLILSISAIVFAISAIMFALFAWSASNSRAISQSTAVSALSTSESRGTAVAIALDSANTAESNANNNAATATVALALANRQAEVNQSMNLALSAEQAASNEQTDLAITLALEAVSIESPPMHAQRILTDIVYPVGGVYALVGHQGDVTSVAVSADGRVAASGSRDNTIYQWSLGTESWELVRVLEGHTGWVLSIAMSPDGKRLVSGSADNTVRLWDLETGTLLRTLYSHSSEVQTVSFSQNGQNFVSGDSAGNIILWDTVAQRRIDSVRLEAAVLTTAFSPTGGYIVYGLGDGNLGLWDTVQDKVHQFDRRHYNAVRSVAFNSNGEKIISGDRDGTIIISNTSSGETLKQISGAYGGIYQVIFGPTESTAISASVGGLLQWDLNTGDVFRRFRGHTKTVNSVAVRADGRYFISGSDFDRDPGRNPELLDNYLIYWNMNSATLTDVINHTLDTYSIKDLTCLERERYQFSLLAGCSSPTLTYSTTPSLTSSPTNVTLLTDTSTPTATRTLTPSRTYEPLTQTVVAMTLTATRELITNTPSPTHGNVQGQTPSHCVPTIPASWVSYTLRSGDTLSQLAENTGTTINMIMSANCLISTTIVSGGTLYLPKQPPILILPSTTPIVPGQFALTPCIGCSTPVLQTPIPNTPPSISISIGNVGTYGSRPGGIGCAATVFVTITGIDSASANFHVWNASYGEVGDIYPGTSFGRGTSAYDISLGGAWPDYADHIVWVSSSIGDSNRVVVSCGG